MCGKIYKFMLAAALCGALSGGLSSGAWAQQLEGTLYTTKQKAILLVGQENWIELEKTAAEWIKEEGANWESWYYQGLAQLNLNKPEQAVKSLSTAFKLSPQQNDKLLLTIADSYSALGEWVKAERTYRELLQHRPHHYEIWNKLRLVLEKYLTTVPEAPVEVERGIVEVLKKQLAFATYINDYNLWLRYATLLVKLDEQAEARTAYSHVLRLNPRNLQAVEWIFGYDVKHADEEKLKKTMRHLRLLAPDNPILHVYLAEIALAEKNKRRAREHYQTVITNKGYPPQHAVALTGLGNLSGTGPAAQAAAMDYYKRAIQIDPTHLPAWQGIGAILRAQNRNEEARRYFLRMRQVEKLVEAGKPISRQLLQGLELQRQ